MNYLCLVKKKIENEVVDTLTLARDKFPGSPVSLDALCKRYRIDNSKRTQHTALIDCDLLSKVYINLLDQKEPSLNFSDQDLKLYLDKITDEALYAYNVYQIEGEGRNLFENIEGDEDTIMGLPIKKIKEYLGLVK